MSILLGVNIDHISTLRQSRYAQSAEILKEEPSPFRGALDAQKGGANSITLHVREDRRHIQEQDALLIRKEISLPLNLEMANTPEMLAFALKLKPDYVCLVPENRQEITTEGGLDVVSHFSKISSTVETLQDSGIRVSLFINSCRKQIEFSQKTQAKAIELHTGSYANSVSPQKEFSLLKESSEYAHCLNLIVNAGHGLNYENILSIKELPHINEFNIGHSIISRAIFCGMEQAVKEMKKRIQGK